MNPAIAVARPVKKILDRKQGAPMEDWRPWTAVTPSIRISAGALEETLRGGQAFRWRQVSGEAEGMWQGTWSDCVARVRTGPDEILQWTCPAPMEQRVQPALANYFAVDVDFARLLDELPWRTDTVIAERLAANRGLRLLRQPLGEALLAFLCSSAKRIPHIAQMCENMAARFGEPVWSEVRALPTWSRLAEVHESDLRACSLGYRARFVHQTAHRLAEEADWEAKIKQAPYPEARAWLADLPGVGPKIADCVLLFGAAKYEAFPVDTWILHAMAERYGLRGWRPAQVAQFGRAHFGPLAGLAQQFLFSGARKDGK